MTPARLRTSVAALPAPFGSHFSLGALLGAVIAAALVGVVAVSQVELYRLLLAGALTLNLIIVAIKWPRAAAVATLLLLPFLALVRRLLIADTGWVSNDPLLLVAPLVAVFLVLRLFVAEPRRLAPDLLSKLVLALLVVALLQVLNPTGGTGLLANVAGLLFLGVPLLWFFLGRELVDRGVALALAYAVVVIGLVVGAYGLWQTEFGTLAPWDLKWLDIAGYQALYVGNRGDAVIRPFSTFSSNSEYAAYVGVGLVFAGALFLHGRPAAAVAAPLLAMATFLAGGRGVMALVLLALVLMAALRTRNFAFGAVVAVLGVGFIFLAGTLLGPRIDRAAGLYGDAVVARNVSGLLAPLDPGRSTLLGHWDNFLGAVGEGFRNPVGNGTGTTSLATDRLDDDTGATETDNDLADAFVSFGLVGGLLFAAIIVLTLRRVVSSYLATREVMLLAVFGLLAVTLGNWLNGGHYALAPLIWLLAGYATRRPLPGPEVGPEARAGVHRAGEPAVEAPGGHPAR